MNLKRKINALVKALNRGSYSLKYYKDDESLSLVDLTTKEEDVLYLYNPLDQTEEEDPLLDLIYQASQRTAEFALKTAHDMINIDGVDCFHMFFHTKDIWFCTFMTGNGTSRYITYLQHTKESVEKRD